MVNRELSSERRKMYGQLLRHVLSKIETNDANYHIREGLVLRAVYLAREAGFMAGIRIDLDEPMAYIELPTGQVSWHLAEFPFVFDGHTTAQKYQRVQAYLAQKEADPSDG